MKGEVILECPFVLMTNSGYADVKRIRGEIGEEKGSFVEIDFVEIFKDDLSNDAEQFMWSDETGKIFMHALNISAIVSLEDGPTTTVGN